jgi:hypothetical protein
MTLKKYIIAAVTALVFASCQDVIDVKLNEKDTELFAVEAKINTIDKPFVFLTKGLPVSSEKPFEGISNAIVTISDDAIPANSVTLIEDASKKGLYIVPGDINYYGVAGREYTVTIETGDVELTARDVLYPVEKIDSIAIWPSLRGDRQFLGIFTYGQEMPGLGNNYKWDIYVNDTLVNDASRMAIANDELVDGNYVNALEIFTDYHDPNKPEDRIIHYGDMVFVKQNSLSTFAYTYFNQLIGQSMSGSLFSVPAANIEGNFVSSDEKEVLGLFTAQDVSVSNTILIDDSIENQLNTK